MTETFQDGLDRMLDAALQERAGVAPAGLEQRLMARLPQVQRPAALFQTSERVDVARSSRSLWTAVVAHAAVFVLVIAVAASQTGRMVERRAVLSTLLAPAPPPVAPKLERMGGGGGQIGAAPVTAGHLPKFAELQIVPPKAPPMQQARLEVEPTVHVQADLKMADNSVPDLGMPNSALKGFSLGNGSGSGVGSGNGNGLGTGSGGGTGGGVFHIGGAVHAPSLLFKPDAEFSEEARKAKFSGDVQVYLWVDEQGNASHVKVVRGVGMGLDEKAVEAVRQYKFKPAVRDGKPVKVDLYVNVNFQIF